MMIMKLLLSVFALLVSALGIQAANPAFQDFFGTNGIIIQTNGNKVQVRAATTVVTNILGSGSVLVTSNNLGTYTVLGLATNGVTNIVILTNGVSLGTPSALNFIYPVTGLLSGATADIGVNSAAVTTGTVANANIWTNQNGRIRPIVYPTFRIYPTNDDAASPILIMGGAGASNWMAAGYGGTLRDYSLFSANIVEEGDLNNRNLAVASAQDTGGARYGYAAFETKTNQSMVFTETLITGGGVNRFIAGHLDGTGNVITLVTNTVEAFKVDGVGGISLMKGIAQNWPDAQGAAGTVLTNDGSGNLGWGAGGGAGGATINPTDGFLPFRSNATTFADSPLYRISTNRLGLNSTNSFLYHNLANGNLGIGDLALTRTGTAGDNTIVGWQSATNLVESSGNTFIGSSVAPLMIDGDENTGVGWFALQSITNGSRNVAIGGSALISVAAGSRNVGIGYDSLASVRNGDNTAIGYGSGSSVNQGIENTFLGFFADTSVSAVTNSTSIGANSLVSSNNQMVFGAGVSNYQFRSVDYIFPRTQGAAGTVLTNNGGGTLGWGSVSGGTATPEGISRAIQVNSNDTFFASDNFLWDWTNNTLYIKTTGAGDGRIHLSDISAPNATNEINALWMRSLGNHHLGIGNNNTNNFVFRSEGHLYPATPGAHDYGSVDNIGRSNVVQHVYASNTFVFLGGTLGAGKVLIDPLGNGAATWGTNVSSLLVTNLTVVNEFKGPVTFQTNVFITNLFLGGVEIRTNQYTTNISHTPVIGSFWFQGTNGIPVTNNARVSMEWIPVMRSWRLGELGANGAGPDPLDSATATSNYWNFTNVGFGSIAMGSNVMARGPYSFIGNGIYNIIHSNAVVSTVLGGSNNIIYTNASYNTIVGGGNHRIYTSSDFCVIGGGDDNEIRGSDWATISGGFGHDIASGSLNATISGGSVNVIGTASATATYSTISGGRNNQTVGSDTTISGGQANVISGGTASTHATIGGGQNHNIEQGSTHATIAGGNNNQIGTTAVVAAPFGTIGGGEGNSIQGQHGTIAGGTANIVDQSRNLGSILGGASNQVNAVMGTSIGNFMSNSLAIPTVLVGHGAAGGNNRRLEVDGNGARVVAYAAKAAIGGTILVTNTPIASAGAAETNLQVVTIGAHVLTNNNERLLVRASGRFAATSNAKEVKLVFGSQEVFASGSQVANTGAWTLDAEIIRTGNTSQSVNASFHGGTNTAFITESSLDLAQTNGIATVLKITGTAAGDADITNRTLTVEWRPAP